MEDDNVDDIVDDDDDDERAGKYACVPDQWPERDVGDVYVFHEGLEMPTAFKAALVGKWRGQVFGARHKYLMERFFDDRAVFKPVAFGQSPTLKKNIFSRCTCKFDSSIKFEHGFSVINPGKFYKAVFKSSLIPDDEKQKLAKKCPEKEGKAWLEKFEEEELLVRARSVASATLDAASRKIDASTAAGAAEQGRQDMMKKRDIRGYADTITKPEADAITWYLVIFIFVARLPFMIVENWAFLKFVEAIRPAYARFLPGRTSLSTTQLKKVYEDTIERTEQALNAVPGKKTFVIDGFKDRVGRHVMSFAAVKKGIATYLGTVWFGARSHGGKVYTATIKEEVGDGKEFIAVVADNTSSMKTQMLPQLGALYPTWFLLGCVPHVMDLLVEDIAKIKEMKETISTFHMIIIFTKRWSLIYEAFLERKTQRMGFKLFASTRFAYAYLLVHSVYIHLPVLASVSEWPEYLAVRAKTIKGTKVDKRYEKEKEFDDYEEAVENRGMKKKGKALIDVMKPLSLALHYLEGDSVPPAHVLPVFCSWLHYTRNLPSSVTGTLSATTCSQIEKLTMARWTGLGRKVGLRADVDCLSFSTDPYTMEIVRATLGEEALLAMRSSYDSDALYAAMKNYNGGVEDEIFAGYVSELLVFNGGGGVYLKTLDAVRLVVRHNVAAIIDNLEEEEKSSKCLLFMRVLQAIQKLSGIGDGVVFWSSFVSQPLNQTQGRFMRMMIDVHSIVRNACSVERINKNQDNMHSRARASLKPGTTRMLLYIFTNLTMIHKMSRHNTFESLCESTLTGEEADEVLGGLQMSAEEAADYLPATVDEEEDDEEDDEDEEEEVEEVDTSDTIPTGFKRVSKPGTLPTDIGGLYVFMVLFDDMVWQLAKMTEVRTNKKKSNYELKFIEDGDGRRNCLLLLDLYYTTGQDPKLGSWVLLKKIQPSHAVVDNDDDDDL